MIKSSDISARIAEYLKQEVSGLKEAKASIHALQPAGYTDVDADCIALVWMSYVPSYMESRGTPETGGRFPGAITKKYSRYSISIGVADLGDAPALDAILEEAEAKLMNLQIDRNLSALKLISMGLPIAGANKTFWRTLTVETYENMSIQLHSI